MVHGGFGTNSTEVLTELEGWRYLFESDHNIVVGGHCSVLLNTSEIFVIGGQLEGVGTIKKTFVFNREVRIWRDGPSMSTARYRKMGRLKKRNMERQRDGEMERWRDRETERQRDSETKRGRER